MFFIAQRIDDCVQMRDIEIRYNVSFTLLHQFFSESEPSDILHFGNTLLSDPWDVMVPTLKVFQAEFSHEVAEDKRAKI